MKRCLSATLAVLALFACAGCGAAPKAAPVETGEATAGLFAMDTYISLTVYGPDPETALEQAQSRIRELEGLWSVTDEGSEIYAANHSSGQPVCVSTDTEELLRFALDMAQETSGALEPTIYPVLTAWGFTTDSYRIPEQEEIDRLLEQVDYERITLTDKTLTVPEGMMLDLGAVGKGYAADETAEVLRENGVESALLDFGGNILTVGAKPDGTPWRVGILDPDTEGNLGVLEVADQSVVVSGGYEKYFVGEDGERYWHIIDPETGCPARSGLMQVAIISEESKLCDALSTSIFVIGLDKAIEYWRSHQNFDMILLTDDREIYATKGIENAFSLTPEHAGQEVHLITDEA